jgi:hypothetical protein
MPAWHAQKHVKNAQNIAKENPEWNNVKSFAGLAPMPAASVQRNVET